MFKHMTRLDSQGWIDASVGGRAYAFFVRRGLIWVRRNNKFKCLAMGTCNTLAAARAFAGIVSIEEDGWVNEAAAKKIGVPTE
jgi:hypothetical protein